MQKEIQPFVNVVYESPVTPETALINQKVADVLRSLNEIQVGMGATSFHVDRSGGWAGADRFEDAPFSFNMAGDVIVESILINGLSGSVIAGAIDEDGNFVNNIISANLDTQAKEILGEFTFQGSGAIAMKTDADNGLWLSPTGILGKKAGSTTFAIDTGGNATFGGTLVAASGTFGTVTAGTLIGATFKTATPASGVGSSVTMIGGTGSGIDFYYDATLRSTIKGFTTEGSEVTYLSMEAASGRYIKLKNSFVSVNGNLAPSTDNDYSCGTSGLRWSVGWFEDVNVDDITVNNSFNGCGSISGCAYIEVNLLGDKVGEYMKNVKGRVKGFKTKNYTGFEEGDVLVWSNKGLKKADLDACNCVTAVSDKYGMPIVLGAEKIKVIGKIATNQFLVSCGVPGYARAWNQTMCGVPPIGTVIAQAMENKMDIGEGVIMAMIRKM